MESENHYECEGLDQLEKNPYCKHGPTILFKSLKKKFYACSACRDRKLCNFYAEFNETKSFPKEKLEFWFSVYKESQSEYLEANRVRQRVLKLSEGKRFYCQTCSRFVLKDDKTESNKHDNHEMITGISDEIIRQPMLKLLNPIAVNSLNAQFIFDQKTTQFILDQITKNSYDSVLCVGCPSIFEKLVDSKVNRFLLDIDERLAQFYDQKEFTKFNMFNGHFFDQRKSYLNFIGNSQNLFVLIDPPYGGIVQLIANTIESIKNDVGVNAKVSVFLFYPYFMENWIEKWQPNLKMLDYKVSYGNQKKFSSSDKIAKKGSPARIFTNIPLNQIDLPFEQGYIYCTICDKYTFKENIHCIKCKLCPSKDGGAYKHCELCQRCVKCSYNHCEKCQQCHLESEVENCGNNKRKTNDYGHGHGHKVSNKKRK